MSDAQGAISSIEESLKTIGGWDRPELGDALHEITHAREAMDSLSQLLDVQNN